ncbi:MAG: oligosaccharide flippase family protein [Clostridia bacterium]|nr:oligosaccharide flippase family protein [Clostridia bacterium]
MKIERTKNAARNILFDGMLKMFNIVLPFIMRTVMLHYLGVQYLGLNGLFKSVLSFLNLAELGVGSAMVFSMYKPIADDDTQSICALLKLYRTFYRVIGLFIAVVGLAITPFLRNLINGEIPPDMNLYVLYFMNLGSTVLTYWLFAYKRSLLDAHQRMDIISKVSLCIQLIEYTLKFISLIIFRNYYVFLAIQFLAQVAINVLTAVRVKKLYPQYSPQGSLPREKVVDIVCRVRDLFTSKLSSVVFNYADTLVISAFMGLAALAIYQNYYFVIMSLRNFLEVIIGACIAGIGNSLVTESEEKNYKDLSRLTMLFCWLMGVSTAMLLCMYQPFMLLWMGEENMLSFHYVICFTIYYYSMGVNKLINMFKDAAGIWRKDRWRPLTAAVVNLGLNLATVQWLGLYGVLLSSVISIVVVQIPWLFHNLFQEVFPRKYLWQYVRIFCLLAATALLSCVGSWFACSFIHLSVWPTLIINACISFLIPNILFFAIYGRNTIFRESIAHIKGILIGKRLGKKG